MKHLILIFVLCIAAPTLAQDKSNDEFMRQFERFSDSAKEFFKGMIEEFGPSLEGLRDSVPDFSLYHPPEVLPNGDIIIRRKTPVDPNQPPNQTVPEGQTEL